MAGGLLGTLRHRLEVLPDPRGLGGGEEEEPDSDFEEDPQDPEEPDEDDSETVTDWTRRMVY